MAGVQWEEQYKSSVQLYLHLLTKQLRESNILPSLVFSAMFTRPPYPPRARHLSSSSLTPSLMEPCLTRYETKVNLSKADTFRKDKKKLWWSLLRGEGGEKIRRGRGGKDNTITQRTLAYLNPASCCNLSLCCQLFCTVFFCSVICHEVSDMTWVTSSCQQWVGRWPIARGCTQVGRCPAWINYHLRGGEVRNDVLDRVGWWSTTKPQAAAGLFVRELMGQIETSWEMAVHRYGSGLTCTHAHFNKLERVVVVCPQITLIAAVTQKEVG